MIVKLKNIIFLSLVLLVSACSFFQPQERKIAIAEEGWSKYHDKNYFRNTNQENLSNSAQNNLLASEIVLQDDFSSMISPSQIKTIAPASMRSEISVKPVSVNNRSVTQSEIFKEEEYFSAFGSICKRKIISSKPKLVCKNKNGGEYIVDDLT